MAACSEPGVRLLGEQQLWQQKAESGGYNPNSHLVGVGDRIVGD